VQLRPFIDLGSQVLRANVSRDARTVRIAVGRFTLMRVTLLLADAAQEVGGKLFILGGGWSVTGPKPVPSAIAIKIEVPWDQANQKHEWRLSLLTQDGEAALAETPEGEQPVQIEGGFEVGRPPGLIPGTPIDFAVAINMGPLPLTPGTRYAWRLAIDDHTEEEWQLGFTVRPATPTA
jgi:hypothetical protein